MDKKVKKVMKVQKKSEKKAENVQVKKKTDRSTALEKVEKAQEKTKNKPQNNGKPDKGHGKPQPNVEKRTQGKVPEKPQNKKTAQMKGKPQGKQEKAKTPADTAVAKRGRPALVTTETPDYRNLLKKCRELVTGTERMVIENYWTLGQMVNGLKEGDRGKYGNKTVACLADDLGRSKATLDKCAQFQKTFTKDELRNVLHNLRWTHIIHLLTIQDDKKRKQLMDRAVAEEWTTTRLAEEVAMTAGGSGKVLQLTDSGIHRIQRKVSSLNTLLTDDFLSVLDAENGKDAVQELENLYLRIGKILEKVKQVKTA